VSTFNTSQAWRLMRAPAAEYRQRVDEARTGRWPRALAVPLLVALILGITTSIAGLGRVTASLVLSAVLCWSFVVLLQLLTGLTLIASAGSRRVDIPRSIELLFDGHGPWSLWLVAMGFLHTVAASQDLMVLSSVVPFAWTAVILHAYGREVLGVPWRGALVRTLAHQAMSVVLIVGYVELTTRVSLRIMALLQTR
jgi:hypothetical protein